MGDLSRDFSREEFACKCGCGFDTVDSQLLDMLQAMRDELGKKITVTSGCRCRRYNQVVKGSEDSQHIYGRAADIIVEDTEPSVVYLLAEELGAGGLGEYDDFTHIDSRTGYARW